MPKTRQFYEFSIYEFPLSRHIDREALKQMITDLRDEGWSLRQIGDHVGLNFTRVRQLLK